MNTEFKFGGPPLNKNNKKISKLEANILKENNKRELELIATNSIIIFMCILIVSTIIIGILYFVRLISKEIFLCVIIIMVFLVYICYIIYSNNVRSMISNYEKLIDEITEK